MHSVNVFPFVLQVGVIRGANQGAAGDVHKPQLLAEHTEFFKFRKMKTFKVRPCV